MPQRKSQKPPENRQLQADALKRRMAKLDLGELEVARACGYKRRDAVSRWRAGTNWPYPATVEKLEQILRVPKGFFVHIGQGISYEDALAIAPLDSRMQQEHDIAHRVLKMDQDLQDLMALLEKIGVPIVNVRGQVGESKTHSEKNDPQRSKN